MKKTIFYTIICLLMLGAGFLAYRFYSEKTMLQGRQAVFLNNGQVYFGYLNNASKQIVELKDVYYLKTSDLQFEDPNKKVTLVKMGKELHSPEDAMFINRDQILFYQTIMSGSKINEAISKFAGQQTVGNVSMPN